MVATSSIEATVYYFTKLEKCCQGQLLTLASVRKGSEPVKIGKAEAEETFQAVGLKGWFGGRLPFQLLEAQEGAKFDF